MAHRLGVRGAIKHVILMVIPITSCVNLSSGSWACRNINRKLPRRRAPGALQALVAEFNWSGTPLGPPDKWPSWLHNTVSLILQAQVPIVTFWGETGTMIYNDHFAEFAGGRHPASLGAPVREVWPEVADINSYVIQEVLAGRTVRLRDQELTLKRNGAAEKVWLNADYSPVLDDEGQPVGVLALLAERTEDILADRKVDAEQARLHQMFDQAPGFIAMLRSPGHIFDLTNAAYMQLIGHRDVIGKPVREALPEIEGQGFYELLDQVYTSGEPYIGSALPVLLQRTPEATPEERFVDFIYQPVRDANGEVSGIFVEGVDVTGRMHAERALQESELQFRTLSEAVPNHVWTSLPDGTLDWFNNRVYQYSGVTRGDLDGQGWAAIVHPDDRALASERWAACVKNGENYDVEFRIRRADGSWRWHIGRAVLIRDASGKPLRWIGTNTDIEDQKQVHRQLADSERRLRLSQRAAGIASMEIDLATDRIVGTAELWRMFGLPVQDSAPATDIEKLVLPEDAAAISTTQSRGEGAVAPDAVYRIRRADNGEIRWIARHMEFLRDQTGSPLRMFGALRDVTVEKEAEERQMMLTHELEHRIKNILATVAAIVSQTLRATDIDTARKALNERLKALGAAHSLLSSTHWTSALLHEVVGSATAAFVAAQIAVSGPPVRIGPKRALALALAVNELGTNSLKYGALSVPEGQVTINWFRTLADDGSDRLIWMWRESGGPDVLPPTRSGFGRILIEQVLAADFAGEVGIKFDPDGVECRLDAPWPTLSDAAEE